MEINSIFEIVMDIFGLYFIIYEWDINVDIIVRLLISIYFIKYGDNYLCLKNIFEAKIFASTFIQLFLFENTTKKYNKNQALFLTRHARTNAI